MLKCDECCLPAALVPAANIRSMYKTVYQAAFWAMQKTEQELPEDLNELVQLLAIHRRQQQQQPAAPPPPHENPGTDGVDEQQNSLQNPHQQQ